MALLIEGQLNQSAVGHELARSGKSYLVYFYAGELFAFELTRRI